MSRYAYFCGWFDCEKSEEEALLYFQKHLKMHEKEERADTSVAKMMIAFCHQNLAVDFGLVKQLYENILNDIVECGAYNNLAALYHHGKGVPQDSLKGLFFL